MDYKSYSAKKILNVQKHADGGWFWTKYSAYPYKGCYFGCEYCYERDERYLPFKSQPEMFDQLVEVKENAPALLEKELAKAKPNLIAVGDWQPAEKKYRLSREMLEICLKFKFPVFILEKSPLVLDDLDLLKKINKEAGVVSGFSIITTKDDATRRIFELKAPTVKSRFAAMKKLTQAGILTGTSFMPILPYIYDDNANLEAVVKETKKNGGSYVLGGGLTLWGGVKPYFYGVLKKHYPKLLTKYEKLFADDHEFGKYWFRISSKIKELCKKYQIDYYIPRPVKHFPEELHFNKRVAAQFYYKARDLQESGANRYKEWAYRKAAWAIDDLEESLEDIYEKTWLVGLQRIPGIGNRLAHEIEKYIKQFTKKKNC